MSDDWKNSPSEISIRVEKSEAYKNYQRILDLDKNFYVFDRNYYNIKKAIDEFSNTDNIQLLFDNEQSQIILYHMIRFVHNFLASAKTLIEHTRINIRKWYKDTEFYEEYCKEVKKRFVNNPLSGFVEELRNYALHYSLPITGFRLSVENDPESNETTERVTFFIEKKSLREWAKWEKGELYLSIATEEMNIESLVDDYYEQVLKFHKWIHQKLEIIHTDDLNWLKEMEQRINEILNRNRSE